MLTTQSDSAWFRVFAGIVSTLVIKASLHHISKCKRQKNIPSNLNGAYYLAELIAATNVAIICGKNMENSVTNDNDINCKRDNDFVTKTDVENETVICEELKQLFPSYKFIGEESDINAVLSNAPTWVVDPIDGTTNFMHSFPFCCVSIGLAVDKQPVVGVVYNPFSGELFQAIRGHGAYLNGTRIHVSKVHSLSKALLLTEMGYDRRDEKMHVMFNCMQVLIQRGVHSIRLMGSACLDLCYVASGRLDGIYSGVNGDGWCPWDYAAGVCILLEAGGTVRTITNGAFDLHQKSIVATGTEELRDELVVALRDHIRLDE